MKQAGTIEVTPEQIEMVRNWQAKQSHEVGETVVHVPFTLDVALEQTGLPEEVFVECARRLAEEHGLE